MSLIKYSLLSFPLASFGLGVWQLKRLEWKKSVIAKLEERLQTEPIDILSIESIKDLQNLEYRRIKAKGRYEENPKNQIFLKPRQLIVNNEALFRGKTAHQSNNGVNIITPFIVDGTNLRILVNRGWLPDKGYSESAHVGLKSEKGGDNSIELVGIARFTDKRQTFGMKNDESSNQWQFRDVGAMARVLKTAPIFLDAVEEPNRLDGPIGGQTQLQVRNEHLNYAITWFSLSALALLMWNSRYRKVGSRIAR